MGRKCFIGLMMAVLFVTGFVGSASAQDFTLFFHAGILDETTDRFGNVRTLTPTDAVLEDPFGSPEIEGVFYEEDNLWLIYQVEGNYLLLSHGPGFFEDAPEVSLNIGLAYEGRYEVILNFLENNNEPGTGPIQAALGDGELAYYDANNTTRATGGTSPGYPIVGGLSGNMFWYSVSLGEVEASAGDTISVRVDDVPGDQFGIFAAPEVASVFQGVTLKVLEGGPPLPEIQVSPGVFDWFTDSNGHQYKTGPLDESLAQEEWLTIAANSNSDSLWNIRTGLGPYGPIIESFPPGGDDAPTLKTSVIFAEAGTYDVYLSLGDTGAATVEDNLTTPNPLKFAIGDAEFTTYVAGDGVFKGTPGYNDYEILTGQVTVEAGEQVDFLIDDAPDFEGVSRSVYLGMRLVKQEETGLTDWTLY